MEEISLREIIEVLLKRKWAIAGITILAVLISGVISFFVLSPVYEAEAILNIRGSNNPNVEIADSNLDMLLEQLTSLPQYDIETYKHQIQDYTFLEGVIKQMGLEKEGYTPLSLQKAVNIEQIPNTSLMKIVVHDGNPTRAAEIANAVTGLFVEGINHQNQEQVSRASIYLEEQMKEKKAELETIMEKYRVFLQDSGTAEELQEEISSKVAAITISKLELEYMQVNLSAAEAEKEALERELESTAELIVTRKAITGDTLLLEAEELEMDGLGRLQMVSEEPNPVYFELLNSLKNKNVEIESLKKRITETRASMESLQQELENLHVAYMDKWTEQERLERELNNNKSTMETLENNYLEMQMMATLGAEEVSINVISPAYAPQNPVQPRKMLNIAVAGVLGLMGSVFLVFFLHYWETSGDEKKEVPLANN